MLLIRAPLRVSFGGGGTDLPAYYERHGGLVISAAISRYCYALVEETPDGAGSVVSADYATQFRWSPARLPTMQPPLALAKAALRECAERGKLDRGVTLALAADAPPGSGLGSSSAMTVALMQALATRYDHPLSKPEIADRACALEIERLGMPIGKQDQYASAYGGVNMIEFARDGVRVSPVRLSEATHAAFRARLLLFWTGRTRDSASILRDQRQATSAEQPEVVARLSRLKAFAGEMRDALEAGDLDAFGDLLDAAWQTKRRLSSAVSSAAIDEWYEAAKRAGARGGKITGAGGGGFLLVFAPPQRQDAVRDALAQRGLTEAPFAGFDNAGVARVGRLPRDWRLRFMSKSMDRRGLRAAGSA